MARVLLTGANGVFGRHIAEGLLAASCDVICICRSTEKAEQLVSSLRSKNLPGKVRYELCDVSDHDDIKRLSGTLAGSPIDILINNAAITPTTRTETRAGIEQQWACNVLGYHWMIKELESNLLLSTRTPARVINVASFYAGSLDLSDVEFARRRYCPDAAYQSSKQANRMQAFAYAQRYDGSKLAFFSCHPGVATSPVSLGLGFDLDRSEKAQKDGAVTPLHVSLDPAVPQYNGAYFADSAPSTCQFCRDMAAVNALYQLLESYP